jgi:hypothetical protein
LTTSCDTQVVPIKASERAKYRHITQQDDEDGVQMATISDAAAAVVGDIAQQWDYTAWFAPIDTWSTSDAFERANSYQENAGVEGHRFFTIAAKDPAALVLWASQEAIVTGPFSQLLLLAASQITNVHLRAAFMNVIGGEHNAVVDDRAAHSHPWLLHRLCESMGIEPHSVRPLALTLQFLNSLAKTASNLMQALGALGVGNERMLIPEYGAVQRCFEACYPEADYQAFLLANILEDTEHTAIIEKVARAMAALGHDAEDYYIGAKIGVSARIRYYDEIVNYYTGATKEK